MKRGASHRLDHLEEKGARDMTSHSAMTSDNSGPPAAQPSGQTIVLALCVGGTGRRAAAVTDAIASRWGNATVRVVGSGEAARPKGPRVRGRRRPSDSRPPASEADLWRTRGAVAEELREVTPHSAGWSGEVGADGLYGALALELRHQQPDLLVVTARTATHDEGGLTLEEILALLRQTRVPILIVSSALGPATPERGEADGGVTRALVATDFGEASDRAGQAAIRILASPATLLLAHVEPPAVSPVLDIPERQTHAYRAGLPAQFARAQASLTRPDGVAAATIVCETLSGDPVTALRTAAREWHADVVAVGTHALSKLTERLLGSVTRGLLEASLAAPTGSHEPLLLVSP